MAGPGLQLLGYASIIRQVDDEAEGQAKASGAALFLGMVAGPSVNVNCAEKRHVKHSPRLLASEL